MLDDRTTRTRIIRAALKLAEGTPWGSLSLGAIAAEAGVSIAAMRREFADKQDILRGFTAEVDRAVLRQAEPDLTEPARDRLFEVLMTRFDVMAPFKGALRAIARDLSGSPLHAAALAPALMTSQYWMLAAAGIDAEPPMGALRVPGLAGVYARVMRVWFDDDDPGHARTMAALDRQLRRGERAMRRLDSVCAGLARLGEGLRAARARRDRRPAAAPEARERTSPWPEAPRPRPASGAGSAPEPWPPATPPRSDGNGAAEG